jgi:hypothetical protein
MEPEGSLPSPPMVRILGQMNAIHTLTPYFYIFHFQRRRSGKLLLALVSTVILGYESRVSGLWESCSYSLHRLILRRRKNLISHTP